MTASPGQRAAHAAVALAAATGLVLHYIVVLGHDGEVAVRSIRFLSYFTILTNILVTATALGIAIGRGRWSRYVARPAWRTATMLYILVVALIYHLLLRHITLPGAVGWTANMLVHQMVPAGWMLCWLVFPPHGGIDRAAPWRWLLYPLLFAAWTLVHGAVGGWYPYPFMDVAASGYPAVIANILGIGLVFLLLGHALRAIDGWLARRGG